MDNMLLYIRKKVFGYPYLNSVICYNTFDHMDSILVILNNLLFEHCELLRSIYISLIANVTTLSRNSSLYHYHIANSEPNKTKLRKEDMLFIQEGMNFLYCYHNNKPYDIRRLRINRGVMFRIFTSFQDVFNEYKKASLIIATETKNVSPSNIERVSKAHALMDEISRELGMDDSLIVGIGNQFDYYLNQFQRHFNRIYESYLRVVYREAKNSIKTMYDAFPSAFQNGSWGLMKAIDYFNTYTGYSFKTYARDWVKKIILENSEREVNIIPISNSVWRKFKKFEKIRNRYHKPTGDMEHVADKMNMSIKQVEDVYKAIDDKRVSSLDAPVNNKDETNSTLLDVIPQNTFKVESEDPLISTDIFGKGKKKQIMNLIFGFVDSQEENASKIHKDQQRDEIVKQLLYMQGGMHG